MATSGLSYWGGRRREYIDFSGYEASGVCWGLGWAPCKNVRLMLVGNSK